MQPADDYRFFEEMDSYNDWVEYMEQEAYNNERGEDES